MEHTVRELINQLEAVDQSLFAYVATDVVSLYTSDQPRKNLPSIDFLSEQNIYIWLFTAYYNISIVCKNKRIKKINWHTSCSSWIAMYYPENQQLEIYRGIDVSEQQMKQYFNDIVQAAQRLVRKYDN